MPREQYIKDLDAIEDQVEQMATLARSMLHDGVEALSALDREVAGSVIDRTDALAQMDEDIEMEVLRVLTLQSPMARDLRHMSAALKLITYINRVGRYGYDIARVVRDWPEGRGHVARMVSLNDMAGKVERMLALAIEAYGDNKRPDVDTVTALEHEVDAMRYSTFRECLSYMGEDPRNIEPCAHYMMVARYLERAGDNVCKMVEKQHWAATGRRLLID